ncbi:RNA pseudouridylate synthase domain-containing protein 2-like isoform X3 [Chrysoperla carnea]|uniref:RNA pseudouridylate synthase domain-containing protein 2-like isoform X3 n=1 Tax=Chrysoperla carnea TaxID=189513 RepID=UPI001D0985F4|nr:RNA pseudouridylate synthase domain-containing protein 2-like isoform X3 [Chrysoperla carnea]
MQHHTGSWYLPWGVSLQKMLALPPMHPAAAGGNPLFNPHHHPGATIHLPGPHPHHPHAAAAHAAAAHHHHHSMLTGLPSPLTTHTLHTFVTTAANAPPGPLQGTPSSIPQSNGPQHQQTQHQTPCGGGLGVSPPGCRVGVGGGNGVTTNGALLNGTTCSQQNVMQIQRKLCGESNKGLPSANGPGGISEKRKADDADTNKDLKKAKLETKALKAKRPGFTDDRYNETSYYIENGLRKVYPYYFTFTTFTKGRWVGDKILDVFAREFRAHPAEEYERCIEAGTLTVNYEKVSTDYKLKHNDLLANVVHRHEVPVTCQPITVVHMDEDVVVVNKPASIPVHPCGRYRHNTVVFILAKEYNLKNLRTIHRLDRLTSGLLLFGRSPKKARQMEHQIRNRLVQKEYVCRVEGEFPEGIIECKEPIEVVSYKIGVCKVSPKGKDCVTIFQKLGFNGKTSIVLCKPKTGRMHQIRVHLQYLGYPVVNDPLYNHEVFGPNKGKGGDIGGKTDEQLVRDLINIHNAENWLGMDGDSDLSMFKPLKSPLDDTLVGNLVQKGCQSSPSSSSTLPPVTASTSTTTSSKVTVATQTGHEAPDLSFSPDKMTVDRHCYECKVRYRDPKPQDLIMYLHAWKYRGPGWEYETELPDWARQDWTEEQE